MVNVIFFKGTDILVSLVEFLCFVCQNDVVWFLYLVLKSFSVSPMYASVVLLSLCVMVAW